MNRKSSRMGAAVTVLIFSVVFGVFAIYMTSTSNNDSISPQAVPSVTQSTAAPTTTTQNLGYTVRADVPSEMEVGQTHAIVAQTVPHTPAIDILWYSSDSSIADVSITGVITAVSVGTTEIYATTLDPEKHASMTLTYPIIITEHSEDRPPIGNDLLTVANINNLLSSDFIPDDLVAIGTAVPTMNDGIMLTRQTLDAYTSLYKAFVSADVGNLYIISGYRSYSRQVELFDARIEHFIEQGYSQSESQRRAALTVNPPGASEHQLGLSIDVSTNGNTQHNLHTLAQGAWIQENAHLFGFIIRYPEDKTEITGINYEPWHLRYVGIEHAAYIYEHNLCLEEYVRL